MASPETKGRMINKEIADSVGFSKLSPEAGVLFCMIIPHLNSYGKTQAGPAFIKEIVCPLVPYLTIENLPKYLQEITDKTNMKWFKDGHRHWIHSLHFLTEHQKLKKDSLGKDKLPNWCGTGAELEKSSSDLVPLEDKDKVKGEEEEKAGSEQDKQPVDNSPKEKDCLSEEKDQTEVSRLIQNIYTIRYDQDMQRGVTQFMRTYLPDKNSNYNAIYHCLNRLFEKLNKGEPVEYPYKYLEHIYKTENGNYNEKDYQAAIKTKGMATSADLIKAIGMKGVGG